MQKEIKDSMDKLEITVIPVDDEPYSKVISLPSSMMSKYTFYYYNWKNKRW